MERDASIGFFEQSRLNQVGHISQFLCNIIVPSVVVALTCILVTNNLLLRMYLTANEIKALRLFLTALTSLRDAC
jgi:hypothetical protein